MSLAFRTAHAAAFTAPRHRAGDAVRQLARRYATQMNDCAFAGVLRSRQLERDSYLAFIATLYPVVVGFNRALIRSIAKVDHVRHSRFVRMLAEQLQEEQVHNAMWRTKLDVFGLDHEALYGELQDYLARFSRCELDRHTAEVLEVVSRNPAESSPGCFPDAPFPEPVLALQHHLWQSASDDGHPYWAHFASQSGVEMVIYDVVSETILPGVMGHPELDLGAASTQWWREHGRLAGAEHAGRTDEEKHLELSQVALNRSELANSLCDVIVARAESTMRLFAACFIGQETATRRFPLGRYRK